MRRVASLGVLSMAVICGSEFAWAQDRAGAPAADGRTDVPRAAARRLEGKIQIDGVLSEPAWQTAPDIAGFVQVEPRSGEAPTEATKVWLTYSRDALYIAVRCEDANPGAIVATDMRRDAEVEENDNVAIILDTYHDHRNAYYFATNAAGALVDGRITENREPAIEWDGIWIVRTKIDEAGWTAEFEIPFKTIGFDPRLQEWGFNISRYLARGRETSRWASPSLDVALSHVVRAGSLTGLEGLSQGVGLDVKPYGLTGVTRDITTSRQWDGTADAGGEIFYRITSNLISSTTINTDFAETEVDARQVNLTRFPLFFPEKRGFFLEDAGIFDYAQSAEQQGPPGMNAGGDLIPFFSRRIGLLNGREVPILAGEKLTGKIGRFDVGVLDVQTGDLTIDGRQIAPSRNLAAARVKANFWNQSYVGAIFTNGDPSGETSNQLGGVDLKLATSNVLGSEKNLSLMMFGSKTSTSGVEGRDGSYGGEIAFPNDLVSLSQKWTRIDENYNPALGFVPRTGVRIASTTAEYRPRPNVGGIRQLSFEFAYNDYYSLTNHAPETKELELTPFQAFFHSGDMAEYGWSWNREQLFEPWEIADGIELPVGVYSFGMHSVSASSSAGRPLAAEVEFGTGSFYSGTRQLFSGAVTWRKDRYLTASFQWERNWVSLEEGDFDTSLVMARLDCAFTPFISLANFVQYDSESANIGLQSRLRWILAPGNEVFVVLNHAWQENEFDRFESAQTRLRVKMNYTFRF
jgi:hypothetical protein